MRKFQDLTGQRFGRLTVLERTDDIVYENGRKMVAWICQCDCGNKKVTTTRNLKIGDCKSCGCLSVDFTRQLGKRRGFNFNDQKDDVTEKRIYNAWYKMIGRCENPKNKSYNYYGERGIIVCKEWKDYATFRNWAIHNGYSNNLTLDRIDVNGNYEPNNCRWVDIQTQMNNMRSNINYTRNGETHTIAEWSRILNIDKQMVYARMHHGWSIEKSLTTPKFKRGKNENKHNKTSL